jgi:hypothetical protein
VGYGNRALAESYLPVTARREIRLWTRMVYLFLRDVVMQYRGFDSIINSVPASTLFVPSFSPPSTAMSPPDPDETGEAFDDISTSSSGEDGNHADTEFLPMAESWTIEQLNVLQLRVEDWKASKNKKAHNLIVQGAIADLSTLPIAPSTDGLTLVSPSNLWRYCGS